MGRTVWGDCVGGAVWGTLWENCVGGSCVWGAATTLSPTAPPVLPMTVCHMQVSGVQQLFILLKQKLFSAFTLQRSALYGKGIKTSYDKFMVRHKQFAEFITSQRLASTEVLVSFDVVSLFTRVSISLAVRVSRDRLENDPSLLQRATECG